MTGLNASYIAGKMKSEPGLYLRVTRFFNGDTTALNKHQVKEVKKIVTQLSKEAMAFLETAEAKLQ